MNGIIIQVVGEPTGTDAIKRVPLASWTLHQRNVVAKTVRSADEGLCKRSVDTSRTFEQRTRRTPSVNFLGGERPFNQ